MLFARLVKRFSLCSPIENGSPKYFRMQSFSFLNVTAICKNNQNKWKYKWSIFKHSLCSGTKRSCGFPGIKFGVEVSHKVVWMVRARRYHNRLPKVDMVSDMVLSESSSMWKVWSETFDKRMYLIPNRRRGR